jgi:branched-subunit amino acid transport protein AzlD
VEKVAPPVAMTVLAFNALASPLIPAISARHGPPVLTAIGTLVAALVTGLLHLWKRNALLSILCGTALYIAYLRFFVP